MAEIKGREERGGGTIGTRTSFRSQCFSLETSSSRLCVPLFTVRGTIRVIGPCLTPRLRHRSFSLSPSRVRVHTTKEGEQMTSDPEA